MFQGEPLAPAAVAQLQKQRQQLVQQLGAYEETNRALRALLRDRHDEEASCARLADQRDMLLGRLAATDGDGEVRGRGRGGEGRGGEGRGARLADQRDMLLGRLTATDGDGEVRGRRRGGEGRGARLADQRDMLLGRLAATDGDGEVRGRGEWRGSEGRGGEGSPTGRPEGHAAGPAGCHRRGQGGEGEGEEGRGGDGRGGQGRAEQR